MGRTTYEMDPEPHYFVGDYRNNPLCAHCGLGIDNEIHKRAGTDPAPPADRGCSLRSCYYPVNHDGPHSPPADRDEVERAMRRDDRRRDPLRGAEMTDTTKPTVDLREIREADAAGRCDPSQVLAMADALEEFKRAWDVLQNGSSDFDDGPEAVRTLEQIARRIKVD